MWVRSVQLKSLPIQKIFITAPPVLDVQLRIKGYICAHTGPMSATYDVCLPFKGINPSELFKKSDARIHIFFSKHMIDEFVDDVLCIFISDIAHMIKEYYKPETSVHLRVKKGISDSYDCISIIANDAKFRCIHNTMAMH